MKTEEELKKQIELLKSLDYKTERLKGAIQGIEWVLKNV